MEDVVHAVDEATTARLEARLRESGALPKTASVMAVERRDTDAFNSTVVHLTLAISPGAPKSTPRQLTAAYRGWDCAAL